VPWLLLGATYSYSDDKFLKVVNLGGGAQYAAGNYLPFAPQNALNLSAQGQWETDWGTLSAGADITFRSKIWGDGYNNDAPQVHNRTGIDGLLNASINLETRDGHWDLRLWGKNLTNTRYGAPTSVYFPAAVAFGYTGTYFARMEWNPPMTFGATASYQLR
jgi:outer membrane receptor protein involved in Fe transport